MVSVNLVDNIVEPLQRVLVKELEQSSRVKIATAFAKGSGVRHIGESLKRVLDNGGEVTVIHGLDFHITDSSAIRMLHQISSSCDRFSHFAYPQRGLASPRTFHPKLYLCEQAMTTCVIVGSSNLTRGGLSGNIEVNATIRGRNKDAPILQANQFFERMLAQPQVFRPDAEYVDEYEHLHELAGKSGWFGEPPSAMKKAVRRVEERAEDLSVRPTQKWVVVKAMEALARRQGDDSRWVPLQEIQVEAERLARDRGADYQWDTFDNSVRRSINENTDKGAALFERRQLRAGLYRLTDAGHRYGDRWS